MIRPKKILFFLLIVAQCTFAQSFLSELKSAEEFEKLSGTPLVQKYGQVGAVKIVYDLSSEKLYFINGKNYLYHYSFCNEYLNYRPELAYFNEHNYTNSKQRRYLLANLNYFETQKRYALEIGASDEMEVPSILELFELVRESTFISNKLLFFLNSDRLQKEAGFLTEHIPVLLPAEVYEKQQYQPISSYKGYGTLRFIEDFEREKDQIGPNDIIVLNETPLYLPEVSGILVSEFQTPLSHLTLLGQNRKIPIAAYKNAFKDKRLEKLEGQSVRYEVKNDTFLIKTSHKRLRKKKRKKLIKLPYDLTVDSLIGIAYLTKKSYRYVGNKASNFGLLYQLSQHADFKTPEGAFAIPFYFYHQHAQTSGAYDLLDTLLTDNRPFTDKNSLRRYLKRIRKVIKETPVDEELLRSVEATIRSNGTYKRMRFRSSTNAEDAKGFSGAGLYTSKTGELDHSKKTIEKAIKKVWASLWSYEAFLERTYFNIPHESVYMGILVHRSFPSEAVNGVAVTKNLYRKESQGFVVNAQLGNENVVNPDIGIISDQFICYPETADDLYKKTIDIITTSNLNNGQLTMTSTEIAHLANSLQAVKNYFHKKLYRTKTYINLGIDVEFKLDGEERILYIKQARIYND